MFEYVGGGEEKMAFASLNLIGSLRDLLRGSISEQQFLAYLEGLYKLSPPDTFNIYDLEVNGKIKFSLRFVVDWTKHVDIEEKILPGTTISPSIIYIFITKELPELFKSFPYEVRSYDVFSTKGDILRFKPIPIGACVGVLSECLTAEKIYEKEISISINKQKIDDIEHAYRVLLHRLLKRPLPQVLSDLIKRRRYIATSVHTFLPVLTMKDTYVKGDFLYIAYVGDYLTKSGPPLTTHGYVQLEGKAPPSDVARFLDWLERFCEKNKEFS